MTLAPSAGPLFDLTGVDKAACARIRRDLAVARPAVVVLSDGPGLVRSTDPSTAQAAAKLLKDRGTTLAKLYRFLLDRGARGATDNEAQLALGLPANSQPTRRNQLVRMDLAKATDRRRITASGRQAVVWVALIPEPRP